MMVTLKSRMATWSRPRHLRHTPLNKKYSMILEEVFYKTLLRDLTALYSLMVKPAQESRIQWSAMVLTSTNL